MAHRSLPDGLDDVFKNITTPWCPTWFGEQDLGFSPPSEEGMVKAMPMPSASSRFLRTVQQASSNGRSKLLRRNPRERNLHTGLHISNRDVSEGGEEQKHGGVQVAAVRDHPPLHLPLDLLRPPQARRPPHRHRQWRRRRAAGRLRRALPRLRTQGHQDEDGQSRARRQRRLLRRRRSGGAPGAARRGPALRGGAALLRAHHRDVCCAHGRDDDGGEDQERGVHALLPVILPLPQRRHLERLLLARQGLIHRDPQRYGVRDGHGAAGAVHGVPEQEEGGGAQGRRRAGGRRGEGRGAPDGAGGAGAAEGALAEEGDEPAEDGVAAVASQRDRAHHQGPVRHPPGAAQRHEPARARPRRRRRRRRAPHLPIKVTDWSMLTYSYLS